MDPQNIPPNRIEQAYFDIPIITRLYATASVIVTLGCFWRILSNFLYFGPFGIDFLFHLFFMIRYCRMLEEGSFRNKTSDFVYMLLLGMICLLIIGPVFRMNFMGSTLTFMIVYVWARRNPFVHMNFLGVLNFSAPYLPWVLLGFSFLLSNTIPVNDFLGIVLGHVYYFFVDIFPRNTGKKPLETPNILKRLMGEYQQEISSTPSISSTELTHSSDDTDRTENSENYKWNGNNDNNDKFSLLSSTDNSDNEAESDNEAFSLRDDVHKIPHHDE